MSYKFSTGSIRRGDIYYEDDNVGAQTYIDFGQDTITLRPSGAAILHADEDSVGVGTTTPGATLHVVGGSPNFRVQDSDTNYAFTVDGTVAAGMRWHIGDMDSTQDAFMTMGAYNSINNIDTSIRDFHLFGTNTTTGFYFDESAGKFGIGTTTPDYTLDVAGDIGVDQYIYHNGDADTWIRFNDDDITFKAGNLTFLDIEKKGSAPHEITVNDGSNNIDFVVKGNGSNEGNPLFKCDASTGRVGINGVGSPDCELHVDGDIKLVGDDPRIKIDGDTDSHPGLELYENGTRKWIIYNNYVNDNLTFKTNSTIRLSIEQDGNVGIGTQAPGSKLETSGSVGFNVTSFTADASIGETHYTCVANCGSNGANGSVTLTLPAATDAMMGRVYVFKRADTGSGVFGANLVIARNGAYIDGDTDNLQLGNGDCYTIQCIGQASGWIVLGQYVPI